MEIKSIPSFLSYYERIRERTLRVARCIPPDQIEWTYRTGAFTLGDLIRHIAALERYMFAENVQGRPSRYHGCGTELADGYEQVLAFMDRLHDESIKIFGKLSDSDLEKKCLTPGGAEMPVWKWLRAMVEHEIHHRGQIYLCLSMLNVKTPPLYGLTSEEVLERSIK